jgi:hypothetical protein
MRREGRTSFASALLVLQTSELPTLATNLQSYPTERCVPAATREVDKSPRFCRVDGALFL